MEFIKNIKQPRFFTIDSMGQMYIPERSTGKLWSVNVNPSQPPSKLKLILSGLTDPTSVSLDETHQTLYLGESNALSSYDLKTKEYKKLISLPTEGRHTTRTVLVHYPYVFISVGSSCDSCVEQHPWRATILRYTIPSKKVEIYAKGLRNAVGLAIHNDQLYATVNQRDYQGDDFPPDTLVRVNSNSNFAWPYCNDVGKPDPAWPNFDCKSISAPLYRFTAHSAPLGLTFTNNPPGIWVALHGSWNRTIPSGHEVVFLPIQENQTGFSVGEKIYRPIKLPRPVGVQVFRNNLFVSDDSQNAVYRYYLD